jgi:hypothetical protein
METAWHGGAVTSAPWLAINPSVITPLFQAPPLLPPPSSHWQEHSRRQHDGSIAGSSSPPSGSHTKHTFASDGSSTQSRNLIAKSRYLSHHKGQRLGFDDIHAKN